MPCLYSMTAMKTFLLYQLPLSNPQLPRQQLFLDLAWLAQLLVSNQQPKLSTCLIQNRYEMYIALKQSTLINYDNIIFTLCPLSLCLHLFEGHLDVGKDSYNILLISPLFYLEYYIMISDSELYGLIKKVVRERKITPHHSTENFAEKYCAQQLSKKKLKTHNHQQKMDFIMKKFVKLDTYIDLPQLLNSINTLRLNTQKEKHSNEVKIPEKKPVETLTKTPINKHFTQMRNLRYVLQNQNIQNVLSDIQCQSSWKSELLKNNSVFTLGNLLEKAQQLKESEENKQDTARAFSYLEKISCHSHNFLEGEEKSHIKQTQLNSQKKKIQSNFLHKVSTILQIVLQSEHKTKWSQHHRSRSSLLKRNGNNILAGRLQKNKDSVSKPIITRNSSNSRCIQFLKEQAKKIRESEITKESKVSNQSKNSNLPLMRIKNVISSRFYTQTQGKMDQASHSKENNSFYQPDCLNQQKKNVNIREAFTFKRRSVRQKLINKLDKFIDDIDDQQHSSKKQNRYYSTQIDKLEGQFKNLYCRYRRTTLAQDKDIQDLKELASQFENQSNKKFNLDGTENSRRNSQM